MKIGVAVFSYCRNKHLEQVLNGLKANAEIDKLYIFQDGLKAEEHRTGWIETSQLIEEIDWCEVKYIKANRNQGLRTSIIKGIDYVLSENDAVVVVEDDCVPTPGFMAYMRACLEKYESSKNIWHIAGYARPFLNETADADIYFSNRMDCWGWGTWKDRWKRCDFDKDYLSLLQKDKELSARTNMWYGLDVETILYSVKRGITDTWDAWWALCILENNGLTVSPYKSYIRNIGFDGTGTNCSNGISIYDSVLQTEIPAMIKFPQRERIEKSTLIAFANSDWGSALTYKQIDIGAEKGGKAIVYGVGNGLKQYERWISQYYEVTAFVDREREGYYAGVDIIKPEKIKKCLSDNEMACILITLLDVERGNKIKKQLVKDYEIDGEKIIVLSEKLNQV